MEAKPLQHLRQAQIKKTQGRRPRDTREIEWTNHAVAKMRFYGVSEQKVKQILRKPARYEEGVAEDTVAAMLPFGNPTKDGRLPYRGEVWVMYKIIKPKRKIISVWRYPGRSESREPVPIPHDIKEEVL